MTKNKIKTIVMVVAILLCLALAGGWIAQTVVNKQKQEKLMAKDLGHFNVVHKHLQYACDTKSNANRYRQRFKCFCLLRRILRCGNGLRRFA